MFLLLTTACSDYTLDDKDSPPPAFDTSGTWDPPDDSAVETDSPAPTCADTPIAGHSVDPGEACDVPPEVGTFTPVVEWRREVWTADKDYMECMMMPAVGSLTDDDGDGDADQDDTPDIVLVTYGGPGILRVVSGADGAEILSVNDPNTQGQGGVALGDLDHDGWQDIVVARGNGLAAYDHDGAQMWANDGLWGHMYGTADNPAIADMDGDGWPEVIVGNAIVDHEGATIALGEYGMAGADQLSVGTASFAADIDRDGEQELVTGNALYARDGTVLWYNGEGDGYPAVGNFDADPQGEIVVGGRGVVRLQDDDGTVLCEADIPTAPRVSGPPTVADFDGDGEAEFAIASVNVYAVFDADCSLLWNAPTNDGSSGITGSAAFDFEGDGVPEVIYADEQHLWAFDGPTGTVKLESNDHSNATWLEYASVADVDGDDEAEIVVCNTGGPHGVTVFGDADHSWVPGRRIWNQHAYSITNVDDDGSIPATPDVNWDTYNSFRSGDVAEPVDPATSVNLSVEIVDVCVDECAAGAMVAWVSVGNAGPDPVEDDVLVEVIGVLDDASEVVLATETVPGPFASAWGADAQALRIDAPAGLVSLRARVDHGDDAADSQIAECDEGDNTTTWTGALCPEAP